MMHISLIEGVAVALCVIWLMTRGRQTMLRACVLMFLFACSAGFILYTIGYLPSDAGLHEALQAMLRGLFSTGRMFLVNDDYGFIIDDPDKQWLIGHLWFQILFWLCHVMALIITAATITGLAGRRLIDAMRMTLRRYQGCYIVLGSDRRALALAANIALHDGRRSRPDARRLVVLLDENISDATRHEAAGSGCVALEYESHNLVRQLKRAGLGAPAWRIRHIRLILMPPGEAALMALTRQAMQLAAQLHIPGERMDIHIVSESGWMASFGDDLAKDCVWPLHMCSEAELAARHMVHALPPYRLLAFEHAAAVQDSHIHVLMLGFGQTGAQALCHIVRNGQFVGSRLHADIVDMQMDRLQPGFLQAHPGLSQCCELCWHQSDISQNDFLSLLDEQGKDINYAVIALNSDAANLEAAQLLRSWYARRGQEMPMLAVALAEGDDQLMPQNDRMVFFAQRRRIYSEELLIREDLDSMAQAVNYTYNQGLSADEKPLQSARQLWNELDNFHRESSRASADFIPAMLHLAEVTPQQIANADSIPVDECTAEVLAETEHMRWNAFHYAMGYTCMETERMQEYAQQIHTAGKDASRCRQDDMRKQHICLVHWRELDTVSTAYNTLMQQMEIKQKPRDFRQEDRRISQYIPRFLRQCSREDAGRRQGE